MIQSLRLFIRVIAKLVISMIPIQIIIIILRIQVKAIIIPAWIIIQILPLIIAQIHLIILIIIIQVKTFLFLLVLFVTFKWTYFYTKIKYMTKIGSINMYYIQIKKFIKTNGGLAQLNFLGQMLLGNIYVTILNIKLELLLMIQITFYQIILNYKS